MKKVPVLVLLILVPLISVAQQDETGSRIRKLLFDQQYTQAVSVLDSILQADTTATWAWYLKGRAEMGLLRYRDALTSFRKAGKYATDSIPVLTGMANAANALGDLPLTIRTCKKILTQDPTRVTTRILLARAYAQHGDWLPAIAEYKTLLRNDQNNFAFHKELGEVYLKADSVEQAIRHLHDAVNLNNHDLALVFQLSNLYIKQHELKLALKIAALGLRADPTYTPLHRTSGYIAYLVKKYPIAIQSFEDCLAFGDTSLFVRKYMGYSLFSMDKYDKALHWLLSAFEEDSLNPEFAYYLGLTYESLKDYTTANRYLETAIRLYKPPKELAASIYREIGNNYYYMSRWIEAYESYREAYALDPDVPSLLYSMGVLCEEHLNDKPKALQYYNRLIKQSKLNEETLENWGEAKVVPIPVLAWRRLKNLREEMHFEGKIVK